MCTATLNKGDNDIIIIIIIIIIIVTLQMTALPYITTVCSKHTVSCGRLFKYFLREVYKMGA